MRYDLLRLAVVALALGIAVEPARGQATSNPIASADDAFGNVDGAESIGIYDQTSVRGFNLEAAGNYRINGEYFVKNSGVSSFFLEKTTIRIGYNALHLSFPGPSGVVDYKLRDPVIGEASQFTVGLDSYEQPFAELLIKHRNASESRSFALGASSKFKLADEQGGTGRDALLAGTTRFTTVSGVRLQAFGGEYHYEREGKFRITLGPEMQRLPHEIPRGEYLGQGWAVEDGQRRILGGLVDFGVDRGWSVRTIAVFSQEDPSSRFTQVFAGADETERAASLVVAAPAQRSTAVSGEARIGWAGESDAYRHDVGLTMRARASRSRFGGEQLFNLGEVDLGAHAVQTAPPDLSAAEAQLQDRIDQFGAGISYQLARPGRFRLNAGILYSDYRKVFLDADDVGSTSASAPWLFNVAALARLTQRLEIYSSISRGLEEAGTAPPTASNRNTVLEASVSTQREIGLKVSLNPRVTLLLAGFDTRKPQSGINPLTGAFGFVADVTHRGIETSLSGKLRDNIAIVAGGVYTRATLSGRSVDAGLIGERPVGVPEWRGTGNISYQVPSSANLSLDAGVEYIGSHPARSRPDAGSTRQLMIPPAAIVDVGARYRLALGSQLLIARAQILNVTDEYSWRVSSGETLDYVPARTFRLLLTTEF